MSLNWEFKDNAPCIKDGKMRDSHAARANCLVWATILVDLGDLTEKTLAEWEYRRDILAEMGTHFGESTEGPWIPDAAELREFMPLHTNVTPRTRRQWWAKQQRILEERARSAARDRVKKKEAGAAPVADNE